MARAIAASGHAVWGHPRTVAEVIIWRLDQATITRQQVMNQARANLLLLEEVGGLPAYVIDATRLPS
jgi:predicted DNA-binding protein with PD1-like motif